MDNRNPILTAISSREQVLFVDGHKVRIQYSAKNNPAAIKAVREIMLANMVSKKD